jgi:hypothetical protein
MSDKDVEVIQVIKTKLCKRGTGMQGEEVRLITQYWDMQGNLLWEVDPCR